MRELDVVRDGDDPILIGDHIGLSKSGVSKPGYEQTGVRA